jgi:hypothetical protein
MKTIESEPAAAADTTGAEAPESRTPENGERETNSSPARKRRLPPYTRSFREFLEQLGEDPRAFDAFRHGYWGAIHPEDAFEDDLFEDLVENRWKLRRLTRTHQAKLVEIRRWTELKRQRRLASEGRGVPGMAQKFLMNNQGVVSLPDSKYKFERTIIFLIALKATVELEGFTEWGSQCLRVTFGENPGLSATELVMAFESGRKIEAGGDEEAKQAARQSFVRALEEEIAAYRKLEALYHEGAIEIPEATRDAELLPTEKDLDKILRQERMLELEYQLKLEQWSAWRMAKRGGAEVAPQGGKGTGVPDFRSARGAAGQLAAGRGSVGRAAGRPPSKGDSAS